jgi:hypothetical protein
VSAEPRAACAAALRAVLAEPSAHEDPTTAEERRRARRHVSTCPYCAGELDDEDTAVLLQRLDRVRPRRAPRLRVVLAALAGVQVAVALPWLFGWNPLGILGGHALAAHLTRDGAIGVIVGVAGITTAWQPRQAVPMLVMALAALGMQVFGFAIDENHDRVTALFEVQHLLVLAVTVGIALFALRRPGPITDPDRPPGLRVVR